jgi:hypothetical protein
MLLAGFTLGLACVDLTPPPEVVDYRNGVVPGSGGQVPIETGGAGGLVGTGGEVIAGGTGAGGMAGAGGTTPPPAGGGGAGVDVAGLPDVAMGSGGTVGSGGAGVLDARREDGGSSGAGGKDKDAAAGAGGSEPDALVGTGGVQGTGGAVGSGGATTGSGGATAGSGGKTGTGGATGTGGRTGTGGATGTGGRTGTGGATGTGGTTSTGGTTGYNGCASPVVPANGVVTNFTDWNATTSRWGSGNLTGTVYAYASTDMTMAQKVEGSPVGLHLTGSLSSTTAWGGGGLTFLSCVTVASYRTISFDVYGGASGCDVELQLQTFAQRPTDQTPPGGCVKASDGSGCFTFPLKSQVVDLSTTLTAPKTVSVTLSGMTNWSASAATQIVGIQWQFTGNCSPNATFTNIKFVP